MGRCRDSGHSTSQASRLMTPGLDGPVDQSDRWIRLTGEWAGSPACTAQAFLFGALATWLLARRWGLVDGARPKPASQPTESPTAGRDVVFR